MTRLLPFPQRWANWKVVIALGALVLLFNGVIFPLTAGVATPSFASLDQKLWYTPQQAYDTIAVYTPQQRQSAVLVHLTVDAVYPLVYGFFFSLLLVLLFRRVAPKQEELALFPWRAVLADYLENLGLVILFLTYPTPFSLLAWITAIFTALKWIQLGLAFLALAVGIVLLVLQKRKSRV